MHLRTFLYFLCISKLCTSLDVCPPLDCSHVSCPLQSDCEHGFARHRCACCDVCVRYSGEHCGGINNQFGICGDGLQCVYLRNATVGICQKLACNHVKCKENVGFNCLSDSYQVVTASEDGCCQFSCACLPDACKKPICPVGEVLKLRVPGNGLPGTCCDQYDCIKVPRQCIDGNRVFANGDKWIVDNCTNCVCRNGIQFCEVKGCHFGNCNQGDEESNECCPRCEKGCISETGIAYKNNDTWSEDACTNCQCINGAIHCVKPVCQKCLKPRHIAGQCCPKCEDCDIICKYGYKRTDNGTQLCECVSQVEHIDYNGCLSIETCRKQCLNGFELFRSECSECHCKSCRNNTRIEPTCDKECFDGFKQDANGCFVCECNTNATFNDYRNQSNGCIDGAVYTEQDNANNSCRHCTCEHGRYVCSETMCSNQACNNLKCNVNSVKNLDPLCNSSKNDKEKVAKSCFNCTCNYNQNPVCIVASCPAAACEAPVTIGASCCPYCDHSHLFHAIVNVNEKSCEWNGKLYANGEQWRKSRCESCVCHDGLQICFQEKCSNNVSCKNLVNFTNRCCPICLDFVTSDENSCVHNNKSYMNNQWFEVSECWHCLCYHGKQICENICEHTDCFGGSVSLCNQRSSELVHLSTLIMLLTIGVLALAIFLSCVMKRSQKIDVTSISWPSTSTMQTTDDRDQRRLNISYTKMDVCEKTQSIIDV